MKQYVGLHDASSSRDTLFACPDDQFYYDWQRGYVSQSHHDQQLFDYSSYTFNAINLAARPARAPDGSTFQSLPTPGIGGLTLSSIKNPSRTVMVAESPAFFPYSWHEPKPCQPGGIQPRGIALFNNAKNMVGFVDGHVAYIKIYWGNFVTNGGFMSCFYDPPANYDYQWSGS